MWNVYSKIASNLRQSLSFLGNTHPFQFDLSMHYQIILDDVVSLLCRNIVSDYVAVAGLGLWKRSIAK